MSRTWIRTLFAPRRTTIRNPRLQPQVLQLEARDVPATIYVSPTFTGNTGDPVADADLVAGGSQPATLGTDAFTSLAAAATAAKVGDVLIVNEGDYTANGLATFASGTATKITFQGAGVTAAAIAAADAATAVVLNAPLTIGNDANASTFAGVVSGASGIVKQGTATLTLGNTNTYTGVTTVNAGVVAMTKAGALGSTAAANNTIVAAGAAVEISGGVTVAEPITLAGDGISNGGALRSTAGSNTWSGAITFATGGARINSDAGTFTISGTVGASGNIEPITVGGVGAMTISGLINSGTTGIGTAGQFNFVGGNTVTVVSTTAVNNASTFTSPISITNNTTVSYSSSDAAIPANGVTPLGTLGVVTVDGGTLRQTTPTFALPFISPTRNIQMGNLGLTVEATAPGNFVILEKTPGTVISGTGELRFKGPATIGMGKMGTYTGPTRVLTGGYSRTRNELNVFPTTNVLTVEAGGRFDYSSTGLQQSFIGLEGAGEITFNALAARFTVNSPTDITPHIFTGSINATGGTGGFTMNGVGTQTLAGASTYAGTTTVTAGTLLAGNSTGSAFGTGALTVAAAGVLGSVSTSNNGIAANVHTINGTLAPGNVGTTGTYTVNNTLTFGATGKFNVDIRGTTPGFGASGYDQLIRGAGTTTTITDGALLQLDFGLFAPAPGDAFKIIDNNGAAITTRFRDPNNGNALLDQNTEFTVGGNLYRISYTGGDGNDVVVTRIQPATTYYVRKDFTAAATDIDPGTAGVQVDGDPVLAGVQTATVGTSAFATITAAVNTSIVAGDKIIVSADAADAIYAEQVNLAAKEILFTFQENPITINSIKGTNTLASVTLGTKTDLTSGILLTMGGDDLNVSLAASISGPGGIVKIGNGALTLNPISNTYTGSTSISTVAGGSIVAGSAGAFSALSPYDVTATGRLVLNGFSNTVGNLTAGAGAIVENGAAAAADAVLTAGSAKIADQSTNDLTFAGTLQDGGAKSFGFVKVGSGVLTLPTSLDFTGPFGLLGGTYTVDTLNNGGVSGPLGKSTSAATNLRMGGGKLVYTGAAVANFDRNITWFTTTGTIESDSDITFAGTITGSTATPGGFIKNGLGKFTFTALNAFQAPNSGTAYGNLGTGNVTVNGGELVVQNLTVRGGIAGRSPVNYFGSRVLTIAAAATTTIKNTLAFDPDAAYVQQVTGAGTLAIDTAAATKANPSITFDSGPNVSGVGGGDIRPLGSIIATPVTLVGNNTVVITGKADRNDVARHSGDLRFNAAITGTAPIQFIGLTSTDSARANSANASNVHFVLNANNSTTYTGAVSIANADLALGAVGSLSVANSLTFNSVVDAATRNRATLFLLGENFTIGSLNDLSAPGTTAEIRNGCIDTANGGTGSSTGGALGAQADATLTITQTVDGVYTGTFTNGPIDNPEQTASTYKALFIVKDGPAKLTVTAASASPVTSAILSNPLAGTVTVSDGTLVYDGSIATAANVLTVNATGTLGGAGSVKAVNVFGTVTGGTVGGAGKLSTGNFVAGGATVRADMTGSAAVAGTDFDQISVTGTVDISGATLTVAGAGTPTAGTPLVIIDNDGTDAVTGTFTGLAEGDSVTVGGSKYTISYVGGTNGNDVTLTRTSLAANVTGFTVNSGAAQRSRITTITVTFDAAVSAANFQTFGAITLTRTGAASVPTGAVGDLVRSGPAGANNHITVVQGAANSLVLTFDNASSFATQDTGVEFGSLTDGYWRLSVGGFQSAPNDLNLRRLFGDSTSQALGTINTSDLTAFGNDFNSGLPAFDFDNNGVVSIPDLTAFGNRFGSVL